MAASPTFQPATPAAATLQIAQGVADAQGLNPPRPKIPPPDTPAAAARRQATQSMEIEDAPGSAEYKPPPFKPSAPPEAIRQIAQNTADKMGMTKQPIRPPLDPKVAAAAEQLKAYTARVESEGGLPFHPPPPPPPSGPPSLQFPMPKPPPGTLQETPADVVDTSSVGKETTLPLTSDTTAYGTAAYDPTAPRQLTQEQQRIAGERRGQQTWKTPPESIKDRPYSGQRTHTMIAEVSRVLGAGDIEGSLYKQRARPADELVTAMLGTACTGDNKAPGCFSAPSNDVPCTPEKAVTGACDFRTLSVPHENPMGSTQEHAAYQALDVGTQIKLQLQRALIRYGYAATVLCTYCPLVIDNYFCTIKTPTAPYPFLSAPPRQFIDINSENALQILSDNIPITLRSSFLKILLTIDPKTGKELRFACQHYTKIVPTTPVVDATIAEAFKSRGLDVEAENRNIFYRIEGKPTYIAFPIWGYLPGTQAYVPNPAYISSAYIEGTRYRMMLKKARGMLKRAYQHLHNAMILYLSACDMWEKVTNDWAESFKTEINKKLASGGLGNVSQFFTEMDAKLSVVPAGAFTFLSSTDHQVLRTLFKALLRNEESGETSIYQPYIQHHPNTPFVETSEWRVADPNATGLTNPAFDFDRDHTIPKGDGDYTPAPTMMFHLACIYARVLWLYWYENNIIGRARRRVNFRAKLAAPVAATNEASRHINIMKNLGIIPTILLPTTWQHPILEGILLVHFGAEVTAATHRASGDAAMQPASDEEL